MGFATKHNQHSMVSDWTLQDPRTWNVYQKLIHLVNVLPILPGKPVPVIPKTTKLPVMSAWSLHRFILAFVLLPMLVHQAYVSATGYALSKITTFLLYNGVYIAAAVQEVRMLRRLTYQVGCLDSGVARDGIANHAAGMIVSEMQKTAGFRVAMAVIATHNTATSPLDALGDTRAWALLLLKLSLYGPILDFFFYSYHRACHEVPSLWMYHRTHHLNKHPTAVHSAFADDEQEIIEMVIVPCLAFATLWAVGLPLNFYEWWVCLQYVTFAEIFGHSGLRITGLVPSPISWLLELVDMELVLEDHDLHHRKGWKKSFNYGKQTRIWDRLFGTCGDRIEAMPHNIDYDNVVSLSLF